MNLYISNEAANWYKEELELGPTSFIRFFVRYGFGGHIPGFSLGINEEDPINAYVLVKVEQVTFYIEEKDAWYFSGVDLEVTMDEGKNEPAFHYINKS